MFRAARPKDLTKPGALSCATLLLVIVLPLVVHVTDTHECMQRPCGILLAHGGVALPDAWEPPGPPLREAAVALLDRPTSPRHIEAEPLRPLRAPPDHPEAPEARPA